MNCQWETLLQILPLWMRQDVDRLGKNTMEELRLRLGTEPQLRCGSETFRLTRRIISDDLRFCINAASRYSPWTSATSAQGYITCIGGHRIGICGDGIITNGQVMGISKATSLCIRIGRDFPGISKKLTNISGGVLIIGSPGCGKTTLLRDYIRLRSNTQQICVVDERKEIFPTAGEHLCFQPGLNTDVLSGVPKGTGIEMVLRSMGPQIIAVDEITSSQDCKCMLKAGWCGVELIATAHAAGKDELLNRPLYRPIVTSGIFKWLVILQQDKSFQVERMQNVI